MRIEFNLKDIKLKQVLALIHSINDNLSIFQVCQIIFLSEIEHLNRHGRPIVGDKYYGSLNYAYGKRAKELLDNGEVPNQPELKYLSQSDIEIIQQYCHIPQESLSPGNLRVWYEQLINDTNLLEELRWQCRYIVL